MIFLYVTPSLQAKHEAADSAWQNLVCKCNKIYLKLLSEFWSY